MNKKKIFLGTPISAYDNPDEYINYRNNILKLIAFLRENLFDVYAEIERVVEKENYDSPEKAVLEDFTKINDSDITIFHHPKKIQSSTLIELGYACAKNKIIIIIGDKSELPYLTLGLYMENKYTSIIDSKELNIEIYNKIKDTIDVFCNLSRNDNNN